MRAASYTVALAALFLASCARVEAAAPAPADGGAPRAPPDPFHGFSHKRHVADNKIGCGVCHPYARHSPVAGLTSAKMCMGCHKFAGKDKAGVQQLVKAFGAGRALEFPRVWR
jgi:hypothetical protein